MSKIGHIYWFLRGSKHTPSSRIQGLNIHRFLIKHNISSHLVCQPFSWLADLPLTEKYIHEFIANTQSNDIVIIQKLEGENTILFLKALRKCKAIVVYLDCDYPLKEREVIEADWIICSSDYLTDLYKQKGYQNVMTIPDAVECFIPPYKLNTSKTKRAVWYGRSSESKWNDINKLLVLLKSEQMISNWHFLTISNSTKAGHYWNEKKSYSLMNSCDVLLIPSFNNDAYSQSKSTNRATQGMALGLPVLASPISAYKQIITNGYNGFLCKTDSDWIDNLKTMEDTDMRWKLSNQAYEYAFKNYSIDVIGNKWIEFLNFIISSKVLEGETLRPLASSVYMLKIKTDLLLLRKTGVISRISYTLRILFTLVKLMKQKIRL